MIKITLFLLGLSFCSQQIKAQTTASCNPNPCGASNICTLVNGAVQCTCLSTNVVGSRCQIANPCNNKPCGANGACFPVVNTASGIEFATFVCQCYSGFTGVTCQNVNPQPCISNPCLNGGICTNIANSWDFRCTCVGPYTGRTCGEYIDYCGNNQCQNGAICVPDTLNGNYTCNCVNGFYGEFCQDEINECNITSPLGGFTSPCQNNGTCFDLVDGYFCQCNGPYGGVNCETYVDPCNPNPCGAGAQCAPTPTGYTCQCGEGFFGNPCLPNPCLSNPCLLPGSQCVPVQPGTLITGPNGCTCPTTTATYVCVCPSTSPQYASQLC